MAIPATAWRWLSLGAAGAALSVLLGAFGAHALKSVLTSDRLETWLLAADYLRYQSLGIILVSVMQMHAPERSAWNWVMRGLALGVTLFSGSLCALALGAPRSVAWITPVGGVLMAGAWIYLALASLRLFREVKD